VRSPVARQAHNLKVASSNLAPATKHQALENALFSRAFCCRKISRKIRSWKRRGSGRRKVAAQNRRGRARRDDSVVIGPGDLAGGRSVSRGLLQMRRCGVRALGYESEGRTFESFRARHFGTVQPGHMGNRSYLRHG
jgi:hypothetical protein